MKPKYWAITILAALAVAAGVIYYANQPALDSGPIVVHREVKSQLPTTAISQIDLKDWKTYSNSQYWFEVSYPAGLFISNDKNDNEISYPQIFALQNTNVKFDGKGNPEGFRLAFGIKDNMSLWGQDTVPSDLIAYRKPIAIPNVTAFLYEATFGVIYPFVAIQSPFKKNQEYVIEIINNCNGKICDEIQANSIIESIIKTFKFIQPLVDTSGTTFPSAVEGWKTYTNSQYGFEFDYPADWTVSFDPNDQIISINEPGDDLGDGSISISKNKETKQGFISQIENDPEVKITEQVKESYNGLSWFKITTAEKTSGQIAVSYFYESKSDTITIAYFDYPTQRAVAKKVLETFKIINKN